MKRKGEQVKSIETFEVGNTKPIESPRSLKAMNLLFFRLEDLLVKDDPVVRSRFDDSEEWERYLKKERTRVTFHVEKIREKRREIIKKEEFEAKLQAKREKEVELYRKELKENEQELKVMEAQMKKEEVELKKQKQQEGLREPRYSIKSMGKSKSVSELKHVKARIENTSTVVQKSQAYFEAHSRVRQLRELMELSTQAKNYLKGKQMRDIEMIVNTEVNLKKKQAESEEYHRQKALSLNRQLETRLKRNEVNLEELDVKRSRKQNLKNFDRDKRLENVVRVQKVSQFQLQLKKEKLQEDDERISEYKQQLSAFKAARQSFRQQLVDDANRVADGEIDFDELKQKYKESLALELEENFNSSKGANSPSTRMSIRSARIKQAGRPESSRYEDNNLDESRVSVTQTVQSMATSKLVEIPGFNENSSMIS